MACSLNPPRLGPRVWLSNVLLPAGMFVNYEVPSSEVVHRSNPSNLFSLSSAPSAAPFNVVAQRAITSRGRDAVGQAPRPFSLQSASQRLPGEDKGTYKPRSPRNTVDAQRLYAGLTHASSFRLR